MLRSASSPGNGILSNVAAATETPCSSVPRFPCSVSHNQCAYCTGRDLSSRYSCLIARRTAGSALPPLSTVAGLPGIARTPRKTSTLTANMTNSPPAARRSRNDLTVI
jgi:hypothetical protein